MPPSIFTVPVPRYPTESSRASMRLPSATFRVPVPLLPTWIPLSVPWMLTTEPLPVTVSVPSLPSRWPILSLLEPPLSTHTSNWPPPWTASTHVGPALRPPSTPTEPPFHH